MCPATDDSPNAESLIFIRCDPMFISAGECAVLEVLFDGCFVLASYHRIVLSVSGMYNNNTGSGVNVSKCVLE